MRLFTLEEARALLPEVVPILERISHTAKELRAAQAIVQRSARIAISDGQLDADPWIDRSENPAEALDRDLRAGLQRLEAMGVEMKDMERGLIDFRHQRDGEVVYLCFQLGEDDIRFWHHIDAGFAGRQPL